MKVEKNIYNIASNYDFLESFLQFLNDNFAKNFSQIKILLPNRRSCREFKEILLKKNQILIPQIKAILDISLDDFFSLNLDNKDQEIITQLSQIKVLDNLDYLFFLSNEIKNNAKFQNLDFYQIFKSAIALKDLFEEIEKEEIDLKSFLEIDNSNLAAHRQVTLEFICELLFSIKNKLIKKDIYTKISYQKLLIENFSQILAKQTLNSPIIIAGSTGTINFNRKLIKEISKQKNGYVFLYNYEKSENLDENHPQFFNNKLVDFLGNLEVKNLCYANYKISSQNRQNFLKLMMLPSSQINKWQHAEEYLEISEIRKDLQENFTLIEAENVILEAKLIAKILKENSDKNCAIISNSSLFADILKLELNKENLPFNDSRSIKISENKLINFINLFYLLIENDFDSHSFLALLKHQYCKIDKKLIYQFEVKILRKNRAKKGLEGLKLACLQEEKLTNFLQNFLNLIKFDFSINSLIRVIENLSQKTWLELVNMQDCAIDIFTLFEKLKTQSITIKSSQDLTLIISQISYFSKSNSNVNIQISSPIEARLLNFDLIIISSLEEGVFPQIDDENWLGKRIRKDLKVDKFLQKTGQNAYDFCNYLSNKKVILSYSKSGAKSINSESIFLTKFKAICKKINVKINFAENFLEKIQEENNIAKINHTSCIALPPLNLRPDKFAITEISKLIKNPYFIYCKKILKLKPLNEIDYNSGYAEFGSFIHKVLEEYIKNKNSNFLQIFNEFFVNQDAKIIWWPKFEQFFENFLQRNQELLKFDNLLELKVESKIDKILLHGRIDRVAIKDNLAIIFDYKTGTIPTQKQVNLGLEPQLALCALILIENQLQNCEISALKYWKLSNKKEEKSEIIAKDNQEVEILVNSAKAGLQKLFNYFSKQENGYIARNNLDFDDYKYLARFDN